MQMLSYCCYNCSLHFHCNLNWNLAKTLAKFTLTSKYISDETGDRSFLTVLQLLKLLSGGRMKNRSRNSRIWIIWIFTIIGKRLGMCRQRAGEWALPPLRIFNIQIINIPPVGDSDLGLDWWLFLIYAKRWLIPWARPRLPGPSIHLWTAENTGSSLIRQKKLWQHKSRKWIFFPKQKSKVI